MSSENSSDTESSASTQPICAIHNEIQNLFCKSHDAVICMDCIEEDHRDCETTQLEHEVCVQIEELSKVISRSCTLKDEVTDNLSNIEQKHKTIFEKFKGNIENAFAKITETLIEAAEQEYNKDTTLLKEEQGACGKLVLDGEESLQQLTDLQHQTKVKTIESMHKARHIKQNLDRCSRNLSRVKNENHLIKNMNLYLTKKMNEVFWPANIAKYVLLDVDEEYEEALHHNDQTEANIESNYSSLPSLSSFEIVSMVETTEKTEEKNSGEKKETSEVISERDDSKLIKSVESDFKHRVNGYRQTDTYHCWFTGVEFLADDRLVLADRNNNRLKLFSATFDFVDSLPVPPSPFDVIQMENGDIAVSVPDKNKVYFYGLDEHLLASASCVDAMQPCYGLATCNEDLLVFCEFKFPSMPCIKIFNKDKQCKYRVIPRDEGKCLGMVGTRYIAVDDKTGNIYFKLAGFGADEIFCVDKSGKVIWRSLVRHWSHFQEGIAAFHDDVVLATPSGHHIARLGECGHSWKTMFTVTKNQFPTAIAFDKDKTKIAITNVMPLFTVAENDIISVYSVGK